MQSEVRAMSALRYFALMARSQAHVPGRSSATLDDRNSPRASDSVFIW